MENHLIDPKYLNNESIMDFEILLQSIVYVAVYLFLTGLIVGWIVFVTQMIKNHALQGIIGLLPIITVLIILKYHVIQQTQL